MAGQLVFANAGDVMGSPGNVGKEDILKRLGSVMAQLEAVRTGRVPMTKASP